MKTEEDSRKTEKDRSNKKVSVMRILLANLTKMVGDTGGLAKVKVILSLFGTRQNGRFCAPLISVKLVV